MLIDKIKIIINSDNDNMDSHFHLMEQDLIKLTQVWNVNVQQQNK